MKAFLVIYVFFMPFGHLPAEADTGKADTGKADTGKADLIQNLTKELDILNQKPSARKQKKTEKNKYQKKIDRLESLEDSSPRSLFILARAYENKGDYKNQVRVLRKLVKKSKRKGRYMLELAKGLGKLYSKTHLLKYREEAVALINKVLESHTKYRERAHLEMLTLLKYIKHKEQAEEKETNYAILKLLQTLIREFGVKKAYVKDICKYFYINEFYSQSLAGCKKAIKKSPKEPSNYVYYALSMKNIEDREKELMKAVRRFPNSVLVRLKTGQFFIEQKNYKSALPHFQKAIKIKPDSAEIRMGLAQSLFHNEKEKESYKHFFKACMLNKHKMLWAFRQAKSLLNQKSRFKLADTFDKGITKCFLKAPKKAG